MNTFVKRTLSGAVYVLLFVGSIYSGRLLGNPLAGNCLLMMFLLFVTLGCTFEFFRMTDQQGAKPCKALGYIFAVLMLSGLDALGWSAGSAETYELFYYVPFMLLLLSLPLMFIVALCVQLWKNSDQPFRDAAYTLLPMLYIALPLGCMPWLHYTCNVLMMCIIMVWVNDSFAYVGGSLCGKHKMWPRHSPGKTWEGTVIGAVACIAVGIFCGPLFHNTMLSNWYEWLILGLICSVVGTLGDLAESMLKRSVGVKDSGNIMPGHGGFLDRFDSLLAIMPFVAVFCFCLYLSGF